MLKIDENSLGSGSCERLVDLEGFVFFLMFD